MNSEVLKKAKKIAFCEGLALSTWIEQMIREKLKPTEEGGQA